MCGKAGVARHCRQDAPFDVEKWEYGGYGPAAGRGERTGEASESPFNSAALGCVVLKWGIWKSAYVFRDRCAFER